MATLQAGGGVWWENADLALSLPRTGPRKSQERCAPPQAWVTGSLLLAGAAAFPGQLAPPRLWLPGYGRATVVKRG